MASEKFQKNIFMADHVYFNHDLVNATFPFMSHTDQEGIDDFNELSQFAWARDEKGIFYKLGTSRNYILNETEIRTIAQETVDNNRRFDFFNPDTQSFPTTDSVNGITAGFVFTVIDEGTFDNTQLTPGDRLIAKAAITGQPVMSDFYLNHEEEGALAPGGATEAIEGIVRLLFSVRLDGSASNSNALPTEKAVADAILLVKADIETQLATLDTTLRGLIQGNTTAISNLGQRVTDAETAITQINVKNGEQDDRLTAVENRADSVEAKNGEQDGRLTALEEWSVKGGNIILGDGTTTVFDIPVSVAGLIFKHIEDVQCKLYVADGNGGYRAGAWFNVELVEETVNQGDEVVTVQKLKAAFPTAPTQGMFKVRVSGLAKAA